MASGPQSSPNIRLRGIRQTIPGGYALGRTATGDGPTQLIPLAELGRSLVATGSVGPGPSAAIKNAYTLNGVLIGQGSAPFIATAAGAQYNALVVGATGVPIFGQINLAHSAAVTGVLPVVNGGTGGSTPSGTLLDNITGFSGTGLLERTGAGTYTFVSSSGGVTSLAAILPLIASASTGSVSLSINTASATQLGAVQLDGVTIVNETTTADTFDPSHVQSGNTLSGANLTVTGPTSGNYAGVISTNVHSYTNQGVKLYYEVTAVAVSSSIPANQAPCIGISNGIIFSDPGSDNNSLTAQSSGGIYSNGSQVGSNQTWTTGDILAVAIDLAGAKFWIKNLTSGGWNQGTGGTQDPASGAGGISFSNLSTGSHECVIEVWTTGHWGTSDKMTLNTGASSFAGTIPAGFSAWSSVTTVIAVANPVTLVLNNAILEGTTILPNSGSINSSVSNCMSLIGTNNGNMLSTVQNTSNGAAAFCGTQWLNDASNYAIFGIVGSGFTPATGVKAANTAYFVSNVNLAIVASPIQFSVLNAGPFTECARFAATNGNLLLGTTSDLIAFGTSGAFLQVNSGIVLNGTLWFTAPADFSTGSGTAALGTANCPATTLTAPTKWLKIVVPGVAAGYIPVWE